MTDFLHAKHRKVALRKVRREVVLLDQKTELLLCLGTNVLCARVQFECQMLDISVCYLKEPAWAWEGLVIVGLPRT